MKVELTEQEKAGFTEQEQKILLAVKQIAHDTNERASKGYINKEELNVALSGIKTALGGETIIQVKEELDRLEEIAKNQGTSLAQINSKLQTGSVAGKTIAEQLKTDEDELRKLYSNGVGTKTYMLGYDSKGDPFMIPFDTTGKAAGPHAASANVGGAGNVASVAQSIDAATLLRLGGNSPIVSQFRNTPWVFNLCNLITAGYENPFAMWYDELAKDGSSANVAEGGTKPLAQYKYELKTSPYKKEAVLVSFTDEFSMDFKRLQEDILNKAQVDLVNRVNAAILPRIVTAATLYNSATSFKNGVVVANGNDFDVIAAMAAQVENATFSAIANSAVMSTFKKHRLGITKDTTGAYINPPASLSQLAFVGNPDVGTNDIMVGDFKNYNIIQRGGVIVRIGYNGTDFAENKFSAVVEQYYFDYISAARTASIVKGPNFATVLTAITT